MTNWLRMLAATGAAGAMALTPMASLGAGPSIGIFTAEHGEQEYEATLCGPDGKALCVALVALHGGSDTERGRKLIGVPIIDQAKPTGRNTWHGAVTVKGKTADGSIKVTPGKSLDIHACAFLVICADLNLPAKN